MRREREGGGQEQRKYMPRSRLAGGQQGREIIARGESSQLPRQSCDLWKFSRGMPRLPHIPDPSGRS